METATRSEATNAIVARHFSGDPDALAQLVEIFQPLVLAAASRVVHRQADVLDAAQETWVAFIRNGDRIQNQDRIGSWLWTVSMNAARKIQRTNQRQVLSDQMDSVIDAQAPSAEQEPERHLWADQRSSTVRQACRGLREADRALWALLVDPRGLDYRQISDMCERPVGSIGPTRDRIVKRLRSDHSVAALLSA